MRLLTAGSLVRAQLEEPEKQNNLDIMPNCSVKSRVCEIFAALFFNSKIVDIRPFFNRLELGNIKNRVFFKGKNIKIK